MQCNVQDMAKEDGSHVQTDASGNPILKDIGLYLRGVFRKQLDVSPPPCIPPHTYPMLPGWHLPCNDACPCGPPAGIMRAQCYMKYIDPSYMIRASPTITTDRIYCKVTLPGVLTRADRVVCPAPRAPCSVTSNTSTHLT
jgi:hypothetical protein